MNNVYNVKTVASALIAGTFLAIYVAIFAAVVTWLVATSLHLGAIGTAIVGAIFAAPSLMGMAVAYRWAFAAETAREQR